MNSATKASRRSLVAALSALGVGLVLALTPATAASAASSHITIVNNCGRDIQVNIYMDSNWLMGGLQAAGTTNTYTTSNPNHLNRTWRVEVPRGTYFPYLADGRGYFYRAC
jgi:hypothetical protein